MAIEPQDLSYFAEAHRQARIRAEDRSIAVEAEVMRLRRRVDELETLVLLYRPHESDQVSTAAEEVNGAGRDDAALSSWR